MKKPFPSAAESRDLRLFQFFNVISRVGYSRVGRHAREVHRARQSLAPAPRFRGTKPPVPRSVSGGCCLSGTRNGYLDSHNGTHTIGTDLQVAAQLPDPLAHSPESNADRA
jgi:hypothetical protein